MRQRILIFAVGSLVAGPALAGNLYDVPSAGSPFYAPTSMHAAHIELGLGIASNGSSTVTQLDAVGRLAGPLSSWLKGEAEVSGAAFFSGSNSTTALGAVGHLYMDSPTHAIGAFAGVTRFDDIDIFTIGGEAKGYFGQSALTGQVALLTSQGSDIYVGNARADHYFTPDTKGSAVLYYYTGSGSSAWLAGLGVEKRLIGSDWGVAASGSYLSVSGASGIWTGRIALKKYFDAPGVTLQQHDRLVPFTAISIATIGR
jgi:hypothetical protein